MVYMIVILFFAVIFLGLMFFLNKRHNDFKNYLLIAVIGGIISVIICLLIEHFNGFLLDAFFSEHYYWEDGVYYFDDSLSKNLFVIIESFILAGLIEETVKYTTVFCLNEKRHHKLYTYLECIIPFLIIGVVFSVIENYMYIKNYENVGLTRVIIFFAGHPLYAMIFGNFYYKHRVNIEINNIYYNAKKNGIKIRNKMRSKRKPLIIGMFLSILGHGMHNFIGSVTEEAYYVFWGLEMSLFILLLIWLIKGKYKSAKRDALGVFSKEYPEYTLEELTEMKII